MHIEVENRKRNPTILKPVATKEKKSMLVRPSTQNRYAHAPPHTHTHYRTRNTTRHVHTTAHDMRGVI
jgi:hypothetical protein